MKFSISFLTSLICFLSLMNIQNAEAGFSNSGCMQSRHLNLSVGGTLDNNGTLIGTESAKLSCDTLSGNGLIRSPQIFIQSKMFAYTGTIDCNGKCTIVTCAPFNENMFKRKGGGEFIIVIDENLGKQAQSNIQIKSMEYYIQDELQMSVE